MLGENNVASSSPKTLGKVGYFCKYEKKVGFSANSANLRGKNAIFPYFHCAEADRDPEQFSF